MTIRLGYQIPNFTYPDIPTERLFETVVAQAREAEAVGFDTVLVMDHFYQLPGIGAPSNSRPRTGTHHRPWPRAPEGTEGAGSTRPETPPPTSRSTRASWASRSYSAAARRWLWRWESSSS